MLAAAVPAFAVAWSAGWAPTSLAALLLATGLLALALGEPLVRAVAAVQAKAAGAADPVPRPASEAPAVPTATDEAVPCIRCASHAQPAAPAGDGTAVHLGLVYRPMTPLAHGQPAALEAALRWHHPERGLLPPDPCLPEDEAGAEALLAQMLRDGLACFQRCRQHHPDQAPAWLALNLPVTLLRLSSAAELVEQALQQAGLAPRHLRLVVAARPEGGDSLLPEGALPVHHRGVGLVLDAFGSGPVTLAQLHQLPLVALRIDRSFVERAGPGGPQQLVIESTVRVADSLNMLIIADGIADNHQADAMAALGCHYAQGEVCGRWRDASAASALPAVARLLSRTPIDA